MATFTVWKFDDLGGAEHAAENLKGQDTAPDVFDLGKMTQDVGITKEQLETIRTQVTPGSSALFVVTDQGNLDLVGERFRLPHSTLIASNLTDAERQVLLETFGNR